MPVSPEYIKAAEEWNATPTPVYDEFNVDWKKLHQGGTPNEAKRIYDMISRQREKLKKTYPAFDFSKARWPAGDTSMELPSWIGTYLAAFQNVERWALSGFESPAHLMAADREAMRKTKELAKIEEAKLKRREAQLSGLFGGKTDKTNKSKRSRKTRRRKY